MPEKKNSSTGNTLYMSVGRNSK